MPRLSAAAVLPCVLTAACDSIPPWGFAARDLRNLRNLLDRQAMLSQAIPNSITELKDHRLYVLERHLRADEVLHPDHRAEVGSVRGEPVYLRCHVYKAKTREAWIKDAIQVRQLRGYFYAVAWVVWVSTHHPHCFPNTFLLPPSLSTHTHIPTHTYAHHNRTEGRRRKT